MTGCRWRAPCVVADERHDHDLTVFGVPCGAFWDRNGRSIEEWPASPEEGGSLEPFVTLPATGYFVVRTPESLHLDTHFARGLPRGVVRDRRWRGLDRAVVSACDTSPSLADVRAAELQSGFLPNDCGTCWMGVSNGWLPNLDAARDVLAWAELEEPGAFEVVWSRVTRSAPPPRGWVALGFDPNTFHGDQFSPLCDALVAPRWHGCCDPAASFGWAIPLLNSNGLFDAASTARRFLDVYATLPEGEADAFYVAEVFAHV